MATDHDVPNARSDVGMDLWTAPVGQWITDRPSTVGPARARGACVMQVDLQWARIVGVSREFAEQSTIPSPYSYCSLDHDALNQKGAHHR